MMDYNKRPLLVFWESTRACLLACKHCRACAIREPLPGELTTSESQDFIQQLVKFGKPYPVLIITGGDVLMRKDLFELLAYAKNLGVPVALSPSVTPMLTPDALEHVRKFHVKMVSISLDGGKGITHDAIRGISDHFSKTLEAVKLFVSSGFTVQINTAVMRENVEELADIAAIIKSLGAAIWEVFFLIKVGRGAEVSEISPQENEDVCHFLFDASHYGFIVRTVEGPFFRRVVSWRKTRNGLDRTYSHGLLYEKLSSRLKDLLGPSKEGTRAQTAGTRDGKGIIFVGYNGDVYPAGFLPYSLGNVKEENIADIYRDSPILQSIRKAEFHGRCGICEFKEICGGSRARAYASFGDALAEDPACFYVPKGVNISH